MSRRGLAFVALAIACVLGIVVSIYRAIDHSHRLERGETAIPQARTSENPPATNPARSGPLANQAERRGARGTSRSKSRALLFFRANLLGPHYGKLAMVPVDMPDHVSYAPDLSCERVHFAAGSGVCLGADRGLFTTYYATRFNGKMRSGWTIPINGVPSRVRVSPSGRMAAITVFLTGHSYASLNFSTQTTIVETATGKVLADLDSFAVVRDHQPFKAADFNFWGVTFAQDESRFYATLWSNQHTYLIEGDLARRSAQVIHDDVECPSLSPDNLRIAFKKRAEGIHIVWRIAVLELKSGAEILLNESRSVDDQVEWLDNDRIVYSLPEGDADHPSASTSLWQLGVQPDSVPRLMMKGASSPSVVAGRAGIEHSLSEAAAAR